MVEVLTYNTVTRTAVQSSVNENWVQIRSVEWISHVDRCLDISTNVRIAADQWEPFRFLTGSSAW